MFQKRQIALHGGATGPGDLLGHPAANAGHDTMRQLLERPPSLRPRGLLLAGPYHNGKTMIAERFAVEHLREAGRQRVWVIQTRGEVVDIVAGAAVSAIESGEDRITSGTVAALGYVPLSRQRNSTLRNAMT